MSLLKTATRQFSAILAFKEMNMKGCIRTAQTHNTSALVVYENTEDTKEIHIRTGEALQQNACQSRN
jgi:hypothetical protein